MPERNTSAELQKSKECNLSNFQVLIVDDFQFMTDLLSGVIREIGVGKVITCNSAAEAQRRIEDAAKNYTASNHIDLALVDWLMPEMNGVELIQWMRAHENDHIKFMPVVLLSAYTSRKVVEAARDSGANEALVKPISAEKLVARIVHIINNNRPFVKTKDFFGPNRRRKEDPYPGRERRKMDPSLIEVNEENV